MTVLIGIVEDDVMYLAADSVGASEHYKEVRKDSKIFRKKDMLIACTHTFRLRDIVKHEFKLPDHPKKMSIEKYIITKFISSLRELQKKLGHLGSDKDGDLGCGLLIAYRGKIIRIETDFQYAEHRMDYDSFGSGQNLARASLYSTSFYNIDPKTRMRLAFESCRMYQNGCCEPPYIIKQLKKE